MRHSFYRGVRAGCAVMILLVGLAACSGSNSNNPLMSVLQPILGPSQSDLQTAATKKVGESIGSGSPLLLDQNSAFPAATEDFSDFHPTTLKLTADNLDQPLPPGDYTMTVRAFCTQWSLHYPGRGLPYKLARIQGKQADAIGALLTRGTIASVEPYHLNLMAWRIQGGVPLSKWPTGDQTLVHELIPDYESGLNGDFLEQTQNMYEKLRAVDTNLLPYQSMLATLGPTGQQILELQRARQVLTNQTLTAERAPDLLYQPTDNLPRVLPPEKDASPSPWAEIQPGVFARFTVLEGNLGRNTLDVRITPEATATACADGSIDPSQWIADATSQGSGTQPAGGTQPSGAPLGPAAGWKPKPSAGGEGSGNPVGPRPMIGYPIGRPAQALILMPYAGIRG